jgi:hypothetical protein
MQCNVSSLSRADATHPICKYNTATERRVLKQLSTKRMRRIAVPDIVAAIHDDHRECEVTVTKPRMFAHIVNCDCVLCSRL